ncbi:MAG: alpha/beta hydrolase, partial [Acidimicrobiia bacterium]|nr:alpha/beta hydrolase [Acidimicrobiia bacterium]
GCAIVSGCGSMAEPGDAIGMMPLNRLFAWLARRAPMLLPVPFAALSLAARRLSEDRLRERLASQMPPADVAIIGRPEISSIFFEDLATKHPTRAKASAQDFALFARPWGFELEQISSVPVHIWQGDQDVNVPVHHAERYADLIPGSTLHLAEGEGHLLVYDRGAEIVDAATGTAATD